LKVPEEKVLYFRETPGFGPYAPYFCPAKANVHMLSFLIETFTKPGDVILDPMAGTGSTGVIANLLGRNAILVELEEKFCRWIRENVELAQKKGAKGKSVVIQGDSRKLSELLKEYADTIVTSPPYSDAISKQGGPTGVKKVGVSTITARQYSENPSNIGNLSHGEISAIITSPPYSEQKQGEISIEQAKLIAEKKTEKYDSGVFTTPGRIRGKRLAFRLQQRPK